MTDRALIDKALEALKNSYSPYSEFRVGAALLCKSGRVYIGCNVENAAFSAGICAERSAVSAAVSQGETEFSALCVVGGRNGQIIDFCPPCGICRQTLIEFCGDDFRILLFDGKDIKTLTLGELLPHHFGSDKL